MQTITLPKVDGSSSQPAAEMNSVFNELQNVITDAGETLSAGDVHQISKAMAIYAAGGDFYTDSGAANSYVLAPVGTKQAPTSYFDGMRIRFVPAHTNTAASTVNVALIGIVALNTNSSGTATPAGTLQALEEVTATYRAGLGYFVLDQVQNQGINWNNLSYFTASDSLVVPANVTKMLIEGWGPGGNGGASVATGGGGGGGPGAYFLKFASVTPGGTLTITINSSVTTVSGAGLPATLTANVGANGTAGAGNSSASGGAAGTATNGDINLSGTDGGTGSGGSTGSPVIGTAGGTGGSAPRGGGGGRGGSGATAANPGTVPGGGGGGGGSDGNTTTAAANGALGAVSIYY